MADSEGVLTQEQIDAMLSGGTVEPAAAQSAPAEAPAEAAVEEPVVNLTPTNLEEIRAAGGPPSAVAEPVAAPAAAPAPAPAPAAPAADNGAVTELANRVASLEATVSQGGTSAADVQGILAQLQQLSATVEGMMAGMQATVGYNAHQTFVCSSCQSQGNVAAKLNCTCCGAENQWGWWPPQEQPAPEPPPAA